MLEKHFIFTIGVNAWKFDPDEIETYPFAVERFYEKNDKQYWICSLSSGEVFVKKGDYIVEIPFRHKDEYTTVSFALEPDFFKANFYEVDSYEENDDSCLFENVEIIL